MPSVTLVERPSSPVSGRSVAVLGVVALLGLVPYAVGVLLPYLVDELHRFPLAEVAGGAHDPKDLWPQGPLAGPVQLVGLAAVLLAPLVLAGVVLRGVVLLLDGRRHRAHRPGPVVLVALSAVVAASAVVLAAMLSPLGLALASWRLD